VARSRHLAGSPTYHKQERTAIDTKRGPRTRERVVARAYHTSTVAGIAWLLAHNVLKVITFHLVSIGWPLAFAWTVSYAAAARGNRLWAAGAAALGIAACYWVAVVHVGVEIPRDLLLWATAPLTVHTALRMAYAALACLGIAIGLVNVWAAAPILRRATTLPSGWIALATGGALLIVGVASSAIDPHAAVAPYRNADIVVFAAVPPLVMALASRRASVREPATQRSAWVNATDG